MFQWSVAMTALNITCMFTTFTVNEMLKVFSYITFHQILSSFALCYYFVVGYKLHYVLRHAYY